MSCSGAATSTNSRHYRQAAAPATTQTRSPGGFVCGSEQPSSLTHHERSDDHRVAYRTHEGTSDDRNIATDRAPIVEGAPGAPERHRGATPPHALRRRPTTRRTPHRGGGRDLPRLFQESDHG